MRKTSHVGDEGISRGVFPLRFLSGVSRDVMSSLSCFFCNFLFVPKEVPIRFYLNLPSPHSEFCLLFISPFYKRFMPLFIVEEEGKNLPSSMRKCIIYANAELKDNKICIIRSSAFESDHFL